MQTVTLETAKAMAQENGTQVQQLTERLLPALMQIIVQDGPQQVEFRRGKHIHMVLCHRRGTAADALDLYLEKPENDTWAIIHISEVWLSAALVARCEKVAAKNAIGKKVNSAADQHHRAMAANYNRRNLRAAR